MGTLLRGDSARDREECLTFFREVSKVRQLGWDPVYLTLAPGGPGAGAGHLTRTEPPELRLAAWSGGGAGFRLWTRLRVNSGECLKPASDHTSAR